MLDASAQHAGRTGREILTVAQWTMGVPARRVDEMLELVSLTPAEADRRVGNYSLGMRQRLGIATALIGNPGVLVLDEPANGLDPAGIRWMRDLLRDFADRGGTVLLSSHLLREVEIVADDIVMIGGGRIVCQGAKADLLRGVGSIVRATDVPALRRALHAAGADTTVADDGSRRHRRDPSGSDEVALHAGVAVTELRAADSGLEDMFLQLTADTQRRTARHQESQESSMTTTVPVLRRRTRAPPPGVGHPAGTRRPRRAAQDVQHPVRVLADGEHRHHRRRHHGRAPILFAPDEDLTYYTFATAIGFPMTIVLPMIAILSITGEWSQRTGLTTFTLVPQPSPGAAGQDRSRRSPWASPPWCSPSRWASSATWPVRRSPGPTRCGTSPPPRSANIVLGSLLCLLTGHDAGHPASAAPAAALVTYFVIALVLPTVVGILSTSQEWFADVQPWVDAQLGPVVPLRGHAARVSSGPRSG